MDYLSPEMVQMLSSSYLRQSTAVSCDEAFDRINLKPMERGHQHIEGKAAFQLSSFVAEW